MDEPNLTALGRAEANCSPRRIVHNDAHYGDTNYGGMAHYGDMHYGITVT